MAEKIVKCLVVYTALLLSFMAFAFFGGRNAQTGEAARIGRAILGMGLTLCVVWCLFGGLMMLRYRDPLVRLLKMIPGPWQLRFVIGCTLLAMAEEAVTTTITNLAPLYGTKVGEAYITASANYIDVITMHSVVVFVPMFVGWAFMLTWWRFTATEVFLLWGASGSIAEAQFAGNPGHLIAGFWFFVYGLMIWLPACAVPESRETARPKYWHYPIAVLLPGLFVIPVALPLSLLHHPKIDFLGR